MRTRLSGVAVVLVAGIALLLPGAPATAEDLGPAIVAHTYRLVPSVAMSPTGEYPLDLHVTTDRPACALHVVQYLSSSDPVPIDRGEVPVTGTQVDYRWTVPAGYDLMQELSFVLRARDCLGAWGPEYRVYGFWGRVDDDADRSTVRPVAGTWRRITDPDCLGGSNLRSVSGYGAKIRFLSYWGGFGAVYGLTGPRGGIATAYIDGERAGRVSFYSATPRRGQLVFGFRRPVDDEGYRITLVMTGRGPGGGTRMYVDAFVNPIWD